jgi:hypothetical protein
MSIKGGMGGIEEPRMAGKQETGSKAYEGTELKSTQEKETP